MAEPSVLISSSSWLLLFVTVSASSECALFVCCADWASALSLSGFTRTVSVRINSRVLSSTSSSCLHSMSALDREVAGTAEEEDLEKKDKLCARCRRFCLADSGSAS